MLASVVRFVRRSFQSFITKEAATAIPAALQSALDAVTALFTALFDIIVGIVFPTTVTPVSVLAAFGIIFPLVVVALGFLYKLVRSGS